ncbi:MAG: hypothetical protein KAX64_03810 [Chromatiaceae bacterium]|nr:hypothetical protein [Chromatiaceae bacterium]MBP8197666.1 hypothetical protein [Chromatiaceae bacterium]
MILLRDLIPIPELGPLYPSLASQVLNDLISQRAILARLDNEKFVVDEERQTIIGLVSTSYVSYGNDAFLADIEGLLRDLSGGDMGLNFRRPMASIPS